MLRYVLRDMTDPEGGFYSAEDADSFPFHGATEKREVRDWLWCVCCTIPEVKGYLYES